MKHCHCHFREQVKKFKAGKLGLFGGILIVGHLLFHVAECLIIPALLVAIHREDAEAIEELTDTQLQETTFNNILSDLYNPKLTFQEALKNSRPLNLSS